MRVKICEKLKDNEKEYKNILIDLFIFYYIQFYVLLFINIKCYL